MEITIKYPIIVKDKNPVERVNILYSIIKNMSNDENTVSVCLLAKVPIKNKTPMMVRTLEK